MAKRRRYIQSSERKAGKRRRYDQSSERKNYQDRSMIDIGLGEKDIIYQKFDMD